MKQDSVVTSQPTQQAHAMLSFDPESGEASMSRELQNGETIPGWSISLSGWHIDRATIADLWAKIRKLILRPRKVDAVALFYYSDRADDIPLRMDLLPEMSLCEDAQEGFSEYMEKLAKALNGSALYIFGKFLTVAQNCYEDGKTDIADLVFTESAAAMLLSDDTALPEKDKERLLVQIRREARKKYNRTAKWPSEQTDKSERQPAKTSRRKANNDVAV